MSILEKLLFSCFEHSPFPLSSGWSGMTRRCPATCSAANIPQTKALTFAIIGHPSTTRYRWNIKIIEVALLRAVVFWFGVRMWRGAQFRQHSNVKYEILINDWLETTAIQWNDWIDIEFQYFETHKSIKTSKIVWIDDARWIWRSI